ncbi:MAG: 4-(cytidine 5'-diphospho)-2-C-methyl-D-erythritol kinase [Acidobacteriota bacterium]
MPGPFTLPSFAKINWFLRVLGKRDDGFHELCTLFQTVSLHDTIHFAESDVLRLTCNDPFVPTDESNLIIRAAKALSESKGRSLRAKIHLEKRIPSPGGLGGGSSNAATALIGLARLWELDASLNDLLPIAKGIGSDVPFFLYGGTALGAGRGEVIEPIEDIHEQFLLLVTPDEAVATCEVFDRIAAASLTKTDPESILRVCRLTAESGDLRNKTLANDLEVVVFPAYPEIDRVEKTLLDLGAAQVLMSGSGASVFAMFDKEETRQTAIKALDLESTWRKFAVATISRNEYREALNIAF